MIFMPELSLYIHIPWCLRKCPYCDFNVYKLKTYDTRISYIKHLIKDLKNDIHVHKRIIKTIFIGGGTPSLLETELLQYLLKKIKNIINQDDITEITIEVNPENITLEIISDYITYGINRISFGIQSFNSMLLKNLGRTNCVKKTIHMLYQIKKYTTVNFNIDLIYGIPGQTLKDCLYDLEKSILINPNHISWYQLSIEKNTIFYYQQPKLPKESKIWEMYNQGNMLLQKSKYVRYEISSYAQNNNFCLHNLNYWKFGDYIGIGCGAHSKITYKQGKIIRVIKKKRIYDYCNKKKEYISEIQEILDLEKPMEYFMNVFRLLQPTKKINFNLHTHLTLNHIKKNIQQAIVKKYIYQDKKYWYVLPKGRDFLNDLITLFM